MSIIDQIAKDKEEFIAIRRQIHENPELGLQEIKTSALVADKLKSWGYEVTTGIGKTGVVGKLKVGEGKKSIGLRADMDALPMPEDSGKPYASKVSGIMHACGHDGHTASLLAAAKYLAASKKFSGTVNLIFQPAEEGLGGAPAMIADGLFEKFPCDAVFSWHNMPGLKKNTIYVKDGPITVSSDRFTIIIKGKGGHAGVPEKTNDPVVAGAAVVNGLQSIVARNVPSTESAVISIGAFLCGNDTSFNIIPDNVKILLSVRTLGFDTRELVLKRIKEVTQNIAKAYNTEADITVKSISAPTINTPKESEFAQSVALKVFGKDQCVFKFPPLYGSEDFSFMLEKRPGCYAAIGSGEGFPVHNKQYDFDDDLITPAAAYLSNLVEDFLI